MGSRILAGMLVLALGAWADAGAARSEPDAEKRARLALYEADAAVSEARKALDEGRDLTDAVKLAGEMVELNWESLQATGRSARRSPKSYKWSEQKLATLARRVDNLVVETSGSERTVVERLLDQVRKAQDRLVQALFEPKKRK
jgi:hypothetical protein